MKLPSLLAPLLVACLAPLAASQGGPAVGPAKLLSGDLAIGAAGGVQRQAAVAAGAGLYLAAWEDHRSGFGGLLTGEGSRDVYARLLGPDGTSPTTLPFRVAGGLGRKQDVQVAWNGQHWLVTWRTEVPTQFYKAAALFGARVDTQGSVLDDPPIVIRNYPSSSTFAYGLGSNGDTWAVVIQGSQAGEAGVEGWIVHPGGLVQQTSSALFATPSLLLDYQLGWDGSQYLLTWSDASSGIQGYRTTSTLGLLGSKLTVAGSGASHASITSHGGGGFLVSFTGGGSVGSDIRYRTVSAAGGLGAISTASSSPSGEQNIYSSVTWNGNGYTLTWWRAHFADWSLRHARIDAGGTLLDPGGISFGVGVSPSFPEVSSLGDGNAQVVWVDGATTPPHVGDVLGTRIFQGSTQPAVVLASSTPRQGFPDLAPGPDGYMAVFTSERAGSISILAQRVNASGDALDVEPIEVGAKSTYRHPGVAWNGQSYLVVWHDLMSQSAATDDVVLARRLAADGTPIDPAPFQVLQGADPSVAAANGVFLVAARFASTTQIFLIHGARVDANGAVLDPTPLSIGSNYARWPSVASFGSNWLVAWQRNPTHDNPSASAHARVVRFDGSMTSSSSLGGGTRPAASASAGVGLVAWGGSDVLLQRIAADGSLLGGSFAATSAPESQLEAAAAWTGSEFVVAWEDRRAVPTFFDDRHDIYATRVSEAGAVLDPSGLPIAISADHEQMPVVAGRDGAALIAYAGHHPGPPHATVRTTLVQVGGACSGTNYCSTSPNSAGSGAIMAHSGSTSVSANDLVLVSTGAVPGNMGIFYYGGSTAQVSFGDGFRCVGAPAFRFPPRQIDAGGTVTMPVDLTAPPQPAGLIQPGSVWHFQFWYRDLAAGGAGYNLSDARSLTFCN